MPCYFGGFIISRFFRWRVSFLNLFLRVSSAVGMWEWFSHGLSNKKNVFVERNEVLLGENWSP